MGTSVKEDRNAAQRSGYKRVEELSSYFFNSASSVQDFTDRFEKLFESYLRPGLAFVDASFDRKPILTLCTDTQVFVIVFLILSFLPIGTYLTVMGGTLVAFILGGIISVLIASIGAILIFSTVLLSVLFGTAIAATFVTTMLVGSFLLLRLAVMTRQDGLGGAAMWASDIKDYVLNTLTGSSPPPLISEGKDTPLLESGSTEPQDTQESDVVKSEAPEKEPTWAESY
ncbi:hypothetical protein EST38_g13057 [Candolleomyces aberdarensis]|uniref:Uncharacterized protein n=1 Tax=Candolleomyces aberdarensis TaxID=2316362 RepID=A0A4Q2D0V2_9AGAR|nr:hypothetical protein EST38_g13057 [Candolleomyces aberdarensis]